MKIKSLITSITLLLVSVFVLSACDWFNPTPTPTPTPTPPDVTTPEKPKLENFSNHFQTTAFVNYDSMIDNLNGETKFSLIDNQLTTFTDNLTRRLLAVYGPGLYTFRETDESGEVLADLIIPGSSESYSPHTLSSYAIIVKPTSITNKKPSYTNDTIGKFASALQHGQWNAEHDIVGTYNLKNSMTTWALKLNNTDSKEEAYNTYVEHYSKIKLDLAKLIADSCKTTEKYTASSTYEEVINTIVNFDLTNSSLQQPISNYILDNIIGSNNKNQSNKAYSILIPQIVKTTLEVKEPNSQTQSIWPALNFDCPIENEERKINNNIISFGEYTTVKIVPRNNVPITKLKLKVESAAGQSIEGLKMKVKVNINSTTSVESSTVFSITNKTAFEIDLHKSEFSGIHQSFSNASSIELTFFEGAGGAFRLVFEGYYDKVK